MSQTSSAPGSSGTPGRSARWVVLAAAVLLGAAGAWFALGPAESAPNVTFTSLQGEEISSNDLQGKVVLVNFWATSCVTCVKKMPMITESYNTYNPQGYEVIAVAMQYDPANYVIRFAESRELPFVVALDPMGEIAKAFGDVRLTPTSFLIDRNGQIAKRYLGDVDQSVFFADIESALQRS